MHLKLVKKKVNWKVYVKVSAFGLYWYIEKTTEKNEFKDLNSW